MENKTISEMPKKKIKFGEFDLDYTILSCKESLPSKGYFYPDNSFFVRGLRFREQCELTANSNGQKDLQLELAMRIYSQCVKMDNTEFENILYEDFYAMCVWIVLLTNPKQDWNVSAKCKECGNNNVFDIRMDTEMDFIEFSGNKAQTLETDIGSLLIAPHTISDGLEYYRSSSQNTSIMRNCQMIKKLNGEPIDMERRKEIYGMMSWGDVSKIDEICDSFRSGIKPIQRTCSSCKKDMSIVPVVDILKGLP